MDINANVDIGSNLTSLLERLAQQIGTTVDKVYPWYVQQAYLEGVTTLVAIAVALLVLIPTFAVACNKACKVKDFGPSIPISILSGFALAITLAASLIEGADAVRKMANPNYYAMKMLTADIGRLQRGR